MDPCPRLPTPDSSRTDRWKVKHGSLPLLPQHLAVAGRTCGRSEHGPPVVLHLNRARFVHHLRAWDGESPGHIVGQELPVTLHLAVLLVLEFDQTNAKRGLHSHAALVGDLHRRIGVGATAIKAGRHVDWIPWRFTRQLQSNLAQLELG